MAQTGSYATTMSADGGDALEGGLELITPRSAAQTSCACCGVAACPDPMAQTGSYATTMSADG
ncbi:hypothetical protein CTI14_68355, partial [Methylobacterium radiotolerans]